MKKTILLMVALLSLSVCAFSQQYVSPQSNADYIHNFLTEAQSCKTGAVTDNFGYIVVTGNNRFAYAGAPQDLVDYLSDYSGDIWDVCVTERGSWFVLGSTRLWGERCPQAMINEINSYVNQGDVVTCATFNDYGDWIVITDKHWSASNQSLSKLMKDTQNKYGFIRSASMTNTNAIIVAENGVRSLDTVPSQLDDYLTNNQTFDIWFIKFTDKGSYLITDGDEKAAWFLLH